MYFFKGETTDDNTMIGLELIQQMFESMSKYLALKLELSKTFGRIEWNLVTMPFA